jgi:hypothetical protein
MPTTSVTTPVTEGEFPTGSDIMLWRPGLDQTRLRHRMVRASLWPTPVALAIAATLLVRCGVQQGSVSVLCISTTVAVLVYVLAGMIARVRYRYCACDHHHARGKTCFLERNLGEYFYRTHDLADLPTATVQNIDRIIAAVRDLHDSTAAAWLNPDDLTNAHLAAWDALQAIDHTRYARQLLTEAHNADDSAGAALALGAEVDALDHVLGEVARYLVDAVTLVRTWANTLRRLDRAERLRTEIDTLPRCVITTAVAHARIATEGIFTSITAARDVLDAGPFAWETTPQSPRRSEVMATIRGARRAP